MILRITFATTLTLACGLLISVYILLNFHNEGFAIALGSSCLIAGFVVARLGVSSLKNHNKFRFNVKNSSEVVYQGAAQHLVEPKYVNGTLYLLNDKLVFQTSLFNSKLKHESVISLEDIKEVSFAKTHRVLDKVIVIVTNNGEERFLVTGNQLWIDELENAMQQNAIESANGK